MNLMLKRNHTDTNSKPLGSKISNISVDNIAFGGGSQTPLSSKIIPLPFKKKFNDLTPSAIKLHQEN
jgi:hypothetical protein